MISGSQVHHLVLHAEDDVKSYGIRRTGGFLKALCSPKLPLRIQSPQLTALVQDELPTQSYLQDLLCVRKKRAYLHINEKGKSPQ